MPSESVASSWHPAFMPNSTADTIKSEVPHPQQPQSQPQPNALPVQEPPIETSDPDISTERRYPGPEDAAVNNLKQPELSTQPTQNAPPSANELDVAPTTSPAGLGLEALEDGPLDNGVDDRDTIDDDAAELPSEISNHANKHLSTMSFTRTVSQDVSWGEDDEVDPEWNLSRTDTDPFKLMPKSDRTNSFPMVPPLHSPETIHADTPLAPTQAGEVIQKAEKGSADLFADGDNDEADFFSQQATSNTSPGLLPESSNGGDIEGNRLDFGQSYGGDALQADDQAQSRFEEGLPLVQASEVSRGDYGSSPFMDEGNDEDDFFAQVRKSDDATGQPAPPSLQRKSTTQAMDLGNHLPGGDTQESPIQTTGSSQGSLDKVTGGSISASASTVLSQVFGDPETPIHNQTDGQVLEAGSGESDLAEKWKAALAGDEFLDDEDGLLEDDEPVENNTALDPATLFGSDDEGFLEDTDEQNEFTAPPLQSPPIPTSVTGPNGHVAGFDNLTQGAQPTRPSSSRYVPTGVSTATAPQPNNSYLPTAPLLADLSSPAINSIATSPYVAPATQPQSDRPDAPRAQSFAAKSKGGYSSPYDLPMEVVKPRKRVSLQNIGRANNVPTAPATAPPPRSTSMFAQQVPPPREAKSTLTSPTDSQAPLSQPLQNKSSSSFFEELPMSQKARPAPRHSNSYGLPATSPYASPNLSTPPFNQTAGPTPYASQQQSVQSSIPATDLVAPERVSPYASLPTGNVPPPAVSSRYSPAPPHTQNQIAPPPVSQARYSPAPPAPRPQLQTSNSLPLTSPPPVLAHQPRTSSPLAQFERTHDSRPHSAETPSFDRRSSSSGYEPASKTAHLPPTREVDEEEPYLPSGTTAYGALSIPNAHPPPPSHGMAMVSQTPPPPQSIASKIYSSPPKRTPSYLPNQPPSSIDQHQAIVPPKRSQTQSPGTAFTGPRFDMVASPPYQRPASVEVPTSPRMQVGVATAPTAPSHGRMRGFSQGLDYVAPSDGREHDPLQRWKGAPIIAWGVGGTIVTSFPKDVPRYGMNQATPMILRSPGEVKVKGIKDIDPLPPRLTTFPGPLKGKSKKKEVVGWLASGIEFLEHNASYLRSIPHLSHEDKRTEERILLWKILRTFVENDGTLEGNPTVDKAVRDVISPGVDDNSTTTPLYATGADLSGISRTSTSVARSEPIDPAAVDHLRMHLLRGEREKAVWEAVDKRLWGHAMLISNTVSRELYKQVAQEFVQKEVKSTGDNTASLAALYEIFAGNFEDSIDELVPASARAGFQMVSTSNTNERSKDALDGLDRWRETLGLVLSNRSVDDIQALNALGKLLSGYGRAEAAHICFLFARNLSIFGGVDDPSASIVLVGSDHMRQPCEFDKELESILLSEVFEYGMSLSSTSNVAVSSPHLSVYKLQHAMVLAEYGFREKALQYCESIASSITSQTRRSPYHHPLLISALDDLSKRLKQSPKSESSSWLSKPSIDKVSGSVWDKLSKFVAGDEDDAAGAITGDGAEIGPFARIAGGTPTISRSPSNSELYGSYNGGLGINGAMPAAPVNKASSRYAPGRSHTPETRSGSYASQPRTSMEGRSSGEHHRYEPQRQMSDYQSNSQPPVNNYAPQTNEIYTPQTSYIPHGNDSPYAPQLTTPITDQAPASIYSSPQPVNNLDAHQNPSYSSLEPSSNQQFAYEPPNGYEPTTSSSYEPPSSGYEPPAYEPVTFGDEPDSPVDTKPKKKSFMDDDQDDIPVPKRPSAAREQSKEEKDREADEAFRRAAEADAQKSATAPAKRGWGLGGWFGAGKKESADVPQSNKPIRAKLGEASSFVYDPDLKRWVNKKGGDTAPTPTATPPPPKSGPPRTASGGPTSAPPPLSRTTPAMRAASDGDSRPHSNLGNGPPTSSADVGSGALAPPSAPAMSRSVSSGSVQNRSPSAPPSRPSTGMSNASSIDDLLGPPTAGARKGTVRKKKGRGYVDVMGEKAAS
ncbi:uncharacterized protein BP5553_07316 [Venustampulla echinocandica]|uniref:Protein transport protein sec16 n=1 Tax=Venustampulla echinocandica TaxID=2656787 RepID=A0A370TJ52_9HELO|nr:uncharacterized protein BP5553_07316 [Venustampulla echinocandica]RDL35385.1 hypothetical protein BP5553_07316 [Venustampulla echinocandica]